MEDEHARESLGWGSVGGAGSSDVPQGAVGSLRAGPVTRGGHAAVLTPRQRISFPVGRDGCQRDKHIVVKIKEHGWIFKDAAEKNPDRGG
jgi:hypothetical protein